MWHSNSARKLLKRVARVKNSSLPKGIGRSGTKDLLPQDGCDDSSHGTPWSGFTEGSPPLPQSRIFQAAGAFAGTGRTANGHTGYWGLTQLAVESGSVSEQAGILFTLSNHQSRAPILSRQALVSRTPHSAMPLFKHTPPNWQALSPLKISPSTSPRQRTLKDLRGCEKH